jgi:hypothetical protein
MFFKHLRKNMLKLKVFQFFQAYKTGKAFPDIGNSRAGCLLLSRWMNPPDRISDPQYIMQTQLIFSDHIAIDLYRNRAIGGVHQNFIVAMRNDDSPTVAFELFNYRAIFAVSGTEYDRLVGLNVNFEMIILPVNAFKHKGRKVESSFHALVLS